MELKIQSSDQADGLTYVAVGVQSQLTIDLQADDVRIRSISLQDGKLLLTLEGRLTQTRLQPLAAALEPSPALAIEEMAKTAPPTLLEATPLAAMATAPDAEKKKEEITALPKVETSAARYGEPQSEIEAAVWQATPALEVGSAETAAEKREAPSFEPSPSTPPPLPPKEEEDKREEILDRMREARGHILPRLAEANMAAEKESGQVAIRYQCPKCGTPGVQPPERLGAIVTCNKCGKAMRLTAKR